MPYRLIVSDLDGTFLNHASAIPKRNMEALKVLAQKNIPFVISSGRSYASIDYFINCISQKTRGNYAICFNGSLVYEADTFKPLRQQLLKNSLMKDILQEVLPYHKVQMSIYDSQGHLATQNISKMLLDYCTRSKISYRLVDSLFAIEEDISKVLLEGRYEDLKEVYTDMEGKIKNRYNMFFSGRNLLEFTDLLANKGSSMEFLAGYLGIDTRDVIAIGDNYNDISMLQAAGLGVAVANAEDEVKAHANYITRFNNDQGVLAEIISEFL